jgi:hypothetical protein
MSAASTVTSVIKSTPQLTRMSLSLFWIYLTLDRRVNKTRRAFEKQLLQQGMSKEDAEKLSSCFSELKNNVVGVLKQGIVVNHR